VSKVLDPNPVNCEVISFDVHPNVSGVSYGWEYSETDVSEVGTITFQSVSSKARVIRRASGRTVPAEGPTTAGIDDTDDQFSPSKETNVDRE
jgi:hypothetical protein